MLLSISFGLLALASSANCAVEPPPQFENVRLAHGILASIAFVIFMPLGAIVIRTITFKNLIWLHAGWMMFAYVLALAALGTGVWMAYILHYFDQAHAIIGLIVTGGILLQPVTGLVHHLWYKRNGHSNAATFLHLWWGRAIIMLAIINGGLGLQLASKYQPHTRTGEIVYGVVAGTMWLAWMIMILVSFVKSRGANEGETRDRISSSDGEKQSLSEAGSSSIRNDSVADGVPVMQAGRVV